MEYLDVSKLEKTQVRELLDVLQTCTVTPATYVLGYLYQRTRGEAEKAVYNLHQRVSNEHADFDKYRGLASTTWVADQTTLLQHHLKGIQVCVEPSNS